MQRAIANDIAGKIDSTACELGAGGDEMLKPLECNEPADTDDARHGIDRGCGRRRKMFEIDSVMNAVNFRSGIRTALAKKVAAVIGFSRDELGGSADFAKEIVAAEVLHEILPMRCDAEWNAGNFFQEQRRVRCPVCEMNVHMVDVVAHEKVCEVESIACA